MASRRVLSSSCGITLIESDRCQSIQSSGIFWVGGKGLFVIAVGQCPIFSKSRQDGRVVAPGAYPRNIVVTNGFSDRLIQ